MCDYEEQVVQCPYNKFHMCLLGRMNKHMWKCHPMEYTRDLDIKLDKKCAELLEFTHDRPSGSQVGRGKDRSRR
jgi:hypothetical protein